MFDTMTLTKAGGGLFGAALIYFLGVWAAQAIYGTGESAHAEGEHKMGYEIAVADKSSGGSSGSEAPKVDMAKLFAAADIEKGKKIFGKCHACHNLDKNNIGPHLGGVVGRKIDSVPDYSYSGALTQVGEVWTPQNLFHFLENPKAAAPGTKMGFAGLKDPQDRADVITYLNGGKIQLASADAGTAPAASSEASASSDASAGKSADAGASASTDTASTASGDQAKAADTASSTASDNGAAATQTAQADTSASAGGATDASATILAEGDPANGKKIFRKCMACHRTDGKNAVGPHLNGVVGRKVDSVPDYSYSGALIKVFDVWTPENLFHYLENPRKEAPGTKMGFAGLPSEQDRKDLIAYLNTLSQ